MEGPGGFGPKAIDTVPDKEKPTLNAEGYQKPPFIEIVNTTFTDEEKTHLGEVGSATSIPELREAIEKFNAASTPKLASEYGVTLDVMEIINQPIQTQVIEGFEVDQVLLNRTMQGVARMQIKPQA